MTIPVWVLLSFTAWTLLVLGATVGVYRWAGILTGRDRFERYAQYKIEGSPWYQRAMRAHANCLENLPVLAGIVVVIEAADIHLAAIDLLAVVLMVARIFHTTVHIAFEQTNRVVIARSLLFNTQFACMVAMVVLVALQAAA